MKKAIAENKTLEELMVLAEERGLRRFRLQAENAQLHGNCGLLCTAGCEVRGKIV